MDHVKLFVSMCLCSVLCLKYCLSQVQTQTDENCYAAAFTDEIKSCNGFTNEVLTCSLNVGYTPGDDDQDDYVLILFGEVNLKEDFLEEDNLQVFVNVWKDLGVNKQFMYKLEDNLCSSLGKNNTPWQPLIDIFKTNSCPINKDVYKVENLMVSLEFAKDILKAEFCGDYICELSIKRNDKDIVCIETGISVEEVSCE